MKKNNKGNPVPSLDGIDKQLIIELLEEKIQSKFTLENSRQLYKNLLSKLQNGVETNKEQPKCEHPYKRVHRVGDKAFCNKCRKPIH